MNPATLRSRDEIPALLDYLGLDGPGADIGTASGLFADQILRGSKCKRVFAIDAWIGRFDWDDGMTTPEYMQHTRNRLDHWGLRAVIMRMKSEDAAAIVRSEILDWTYLDTSHKYQQTLDEILAWWGALAPGGLSMGHDYTGISPGVQLAVDEFVREMGLTLWLTECDEVAHGYPVRSWIIQKPLR